MASKYPHDEHVNPVFPIRHSQIPLCKQVPSFSQDKIPPALQPSTKTDFVNKS